MEEVGPDSACLDLVTNLGTYPTCYRYNCVDEDTLELIIAGNNYSCPTEGGIVPLSTNFGFESASIQCPRARYFHLVF